MSLIVIMENRRLRRLKKALKNTEGLQYRIFENVGEGVAILNTGLEVQYLNPAASRMVKFESDDGRPSHCYSLFFGLREPCENCPALSAMKSGVYTANEKFFSDGTILQISATPLKDEQGHLEGFIEIFTDISEKKQLEVDLAEIEEKLRLTLDSIVEGVIITDSKGRIVRMNPTAESIVARKTSEVVGMLVSSLFFLTNPETSSPGRNLVDAVIKSRKPETLNAFLKYQNREGRLYYLSQSAAPVINNEDSLQGVILVFQNVTEEFHKQEQLSLSEKQFRSLFNANPQGICLLIKGKLKDVNPEFCRITGFPREELLGESLSILNPEKNLQDSLLDALLEAERPSRISNMETILKNKNGRKVPVLISASEYQVSETLKGIIINLQNIAARKKAEQRLDALFNSMPEVVLFCKMEYNDRQNPLDYRILSVNSAFRRLPQFREGEYSGMLMSQLIRLHPPPFLEEAAGVIQRQTTFHLGNWTSLFGKNMGISLIPFSENNFAIIATDRTNQAVMEKLLFQKKKMEAIGQLAGGIAHDFNNILSGILGFAEVLQQHLAEDPPFNTYCAEIIAGSEKAAELTHQLLSYSRKRVLKTELLDMHRLIRDFSKELSENHSGRVRITEKLDAKEHFILGDAGQLEEALFQLGRNAMESLDDEGEILLSTGNRDLTAEECDLEQISPGKYFYFSIMDSGKGMDLGIREKVFEPFFSTKEVGKGSGMGLSMVYGIVVSHDGTLWVNSSPGQGTILTLFLPLPDSKTAEKQSEENNAKHD